MHTYGIISHILEKVKKDLIILCLQIGLNGIRNTAIYKIMEVVGGRKDYEVDCIAEEFKDWNVSW